MKFRFFIVPPSITIRLIRINITMIVFDFIIALKPVLFANPIVARNISRISAKGVLGKYTFCNKLENS